MRWERGSVVLTIFAAGCVGAPGASAPPEQPARPEVARPSSGDGTKLEYWVNALDDPSARPLAIVRLQELYEDAIVTSNDREAPRVRALVDDIIAPLTNTYVRSYAELDKRSRVRLIRLLCDFADPRTAPAMNQAFEGFARNPTGDRNEDDIRWAARAVTRLKLDSVANALLATFLKLRASTMLGGIAYRDVHRAMVTIPQRAWASSLIVTLSKNLTRPKGVGDKRGIDGYRDELFWQTTAAQVLSELRVIEAIDPLMNVLFDADKADVHLSAVLALLRIGKPAVTSAIRVLEGNAAAQRPRALEAAAIVLGTIGVKEGVPPLVQALKTEKDPAKRAVLARELTKLPPSKESKAAFRTAFESIPPDTTAPAGEMALQMLADSCVGFHDPSMIDWLLARARVAKGSREQVQALQRALVNSAISLAQPQQLGKVEAAAKKWGAQFETDYYARAEKVTSKCGVESACYLEEMTRSDNQTRDNQRVAIKAGHMLAILGNDATRDEIIARLDTLENAAVHFVGTLAIDALAPDGSKAAATKIQELLEKHQDTGDPQLIQRDHALKQVAYRLQARAE